MVDIENKRWRHTSFKTIKNGTKNIIAHIGLLKKMVFRRAIRQDKDIKRILSSKGIHLEGHQTQKNKFDPYFGVGSMNSCLNKGNKFTLW